MKRFWGGHFGYVLFLVGQKDMKVTSTFLNKTIHFQTLTIVAHLKTNTMIIDTQDHGYKKKSLSFIFECAPTGINLNLLFE